MLLQSSIGRFHPAGKFFLLLGLFLLCLGTASVIQVLIILPYADLSSMDDLAKMGDFSNPDIIKGMQIAQAVSVLLTFIIPSFLFAYLVRPCLPRRQDPAGGELESAISFRSGKWGGAFSYLKMNTGFKMISGVSVVILVFAVMPLINWTGELNSRLSLPGFMSELENWMKASEDSLQKLTEAFLQMNGIGDLLVNLIVVALLAAAGEELFFRGCMQNVFLEWLNYRKAPLDIVHPDKVGSRDERHEKYEINTMNAHLAVWITAILFSALHAQFYGFLPRMLLGVALGYLYMWSGSLWLPMLFHFLNNGLVVLFAYLIGKGAISESAETMGAGESPIYFVMVSGMVSVGLMYFIYKQGKNENICR